MLQSTVSFFQSANNLITGLTTIEENPFRGNQLMVDSIRSGKEEGEEEVDEAEQGFIMEKIDNHIEIVPSKSPVYENLSPVGEPEENPMDIQLKALYEGEGVSPPHYDERAPVDGAESEGGDEEDEEEGFQQQNFITNDLMFTAGGPFGISENRETIDLADSAPHYQHDAEEGEEEGREAEEQF
jgi:hypothetical protein